VGENDAEEESQSEALQFRQRMGTCDKEPDEEPDLGDLVVILVVNLRWGSAASQLPPVALPPPAGFSMRRRGSRRRVIHFQESIFEVRMQRIAHVGMSIA